MSGNLLNTLTTNGGSILTDRELRKLSKTELLWIIRDQEEEILELKEKVENLTSDKEDKE